MMIWKKQYKNSCLSKIWNYIKQCYHVAWGVEKNSESKNLKVAETNKDIFIKKNRITCFQHDLAYGDFKDLPRRIASDDGYQRGLT